MRIGTVAAIVLQGICCAGQVQVVGDRTLQLGGGSGTGALFSVVPAADQSWGIRLESPGRAGVSQLRPVQVSLYTTAGLSWQGGEGYSRVRETSGSLIGSAVLKPENGLSFHVEDSWSASDGILQLHRRLRVECAACRDEEGFVSGLFLSPEEPVSLSDVRFFVPGTMYGAPEHVLHSAVGGISSYQAGRFEIREDQMPAPLLGAWFGDGSSVALLNPQPAGDSTAADFAEPATPLVSDRFRFGAMGAAQDAEGALRIGWWFPGTHGHLRGQAPVSTGTLRRYHPVRDGFVQEYRLAFRSGDRETFHSFYRNAWRWSWKTIQPQVTWHDLDVVRRVATDMLAGQVIAGNGVTGLPNSINLLTEPHLVDRKAVMGFTGKCLEASVLMLMEAERETAGARSEELRRKAMAIIGTFLKLKVAPPEGEGFQLDSGEPALALPHDKVVYLRSFTDDMKILLRGYAFEREHGRLHPEWLAWCRTFGDWLLTQQRPDGAFPRSWEPRTGKVADGAPQSSYNPGPMLLQLTELTGETKYREAALRAAEHCWSTEHAQDHFVGGTIDNPNVLDKEAATLALEAYLALYGATRETRWLHRAEAAADFAETFTYLWNVPMPEDADNLRLHWKKGLPTVGLNVVSTSRPGLADLYLAFDVDEYAKLYEITGDEHRLETARLLLHSTKNILAIPGRLNGLPAPGWQNEHISLGPPHRGIGLNKLWLPWVSTCQLHGIVFTEQSTPEIFRRLSAHTVRLGVE